MMTKTLALVVLGFAIGCGGGINGPTITDGADGGGSDAESRDAAHGDSSDHDSSGPFACGKTICGGAAYCIHPCCGGAPPACLPVNDAGGCEPGSTYEASCGFGTPAAGCRPDPCTPPEPYCAPKPDDCGPLQSGARDVSCVCG